VNNFVEERNKEGIRKMEQLKSRFALDDDSLQKLSVIHKPCNPSLVLAMTLTLDKADKTETSLYQKF